jgi:exosortase family protein XrtF
MKEFVKRFKPTILFLVKFVGLYFILNIGYGYYIKSFERRPDDITFWVTRQTSVALGVFGWETAVQPNPQKPTVPIYYNGDGIVTVYEGCNGINVAIIFLCFLVSFGPLNKNLIWFIPVGLVIIHFFNIARIFLLFLVVIHQPDYTYFMHKYFFTAIIYAAVFLLWLWWIKVNHRKAA